MFGAVAPHPSFSCCFTHKKKEKSVGNSDTFLPPFKLIFQANNTSRYRQWLCAFPRGQQVAR